MPTIIAVNPVGRKKSKKRRTGKKTKGKTIMAKKRRGRKTKAEKPKFRYRTKTKVIRRYIKSRAEKRVSRRRSQTVGESMNLAKVFRAAGAVSIGMIIAKVAVNKLTEGGSEKEAWTWPNIFMAAGASVVAAFILGAFGVRKPCVILIAVGGIGLALFKVFTCKIAPKWGWTESWFGETDVSPGLDLEVADYEPAAGIGAGGGMLVPMNPAMGQSGGGGQLVAMNPTMGQSDYSQITKQAQMMYATGGMY